MKTQTNHMNLDIFERVNFWKVQILEVKFLKMLVFATMIMFLTFFRVEGKILKVG